MKNSKTIWLDPYKIIDPTKPHDGLATQGRSSGGRFTIKSVLNTMSDDNFAINAAYWAMYARGAIREIIKLRGEKLINRIIPKKYRRQKYLSNRMVCEMYEMAKDAIEAGKPNKDAIEVARTYLLEKQKEILARKVEQLYGKDTKEFASLDLEEALAKVLLDENK